MTRTDALTTALRSLDAAERRPDPASPRARADLERILATDLGPAPAPSGRPAGRRTPPRLAITAGAVVALTAGAVAVESLTGGDQAFASWTATPAGMTPQEQADAAADCRRAQQDGAGAEDADDLAAARPVVAERRGVWTTVVLAGADGFSAVCITDDSAPLFAGDLIGSVGTSPAAAPGPRELVATDLGTGSMDAGELSLAVGVAGADVVGVVYDSPAQGEVAASVSRGHFVLWLPGSDLEDAATSGVEVEVTYRDGSTGTSLLGL